MMPGEPSDAIFDSLPLLYRTEGGDGLLACVRAAQTLADGLRRVVERPAQGLGSEATGCDLLEAGGVEHDVLAGTAEGLARWLAARSIPRPAIWPCVEVIPAGDGWLAVRAPRACRSVVLAWTAGDLEAPPEEFAVPELLVPLGTGVYAALLGQAPRMRRPVPGMRLEGYIFWERSVAAGARRGSNGAGGVQS